MYIVSLDSVWELLYTLSMVSGRYSGHRLQSLGESVVLAVNQEYVDREQVLHLRPGDEVAVIPPISGG